MRSIYGQKWRKWDCKIYLEKNGTVVGVTILYGAQNVELPGGHDFFFCNCVP